MPTDKDYDNFVARMGSFSDTLSEKEPEEEPEKSHSIYHYGILGMRWGRRRGSAPTVSSSSKKKSSDSDDTDEVKNIPTKELKDITSRLQLEKQYKDLTPPKPGKKTDYEKSVELKGKGYKNLSTKELKDLTTRLQLEQQYKNLVPNDYQKGMNFVKGVTAAGTAIAGLYALSQTPLGKDIKKALTAAKTPGVNLNWIPL
jgi:hypothetical protein